MFTLEETHIFSPTLVNTVRAGVNREYAANNKSFSAINPAAADLSLGAQPGQYAAQVLISGVPPGSSGGINGTSRTLFGWTSYQGYDDAVLTRGTHSLKFGAALERMQLNHLATPNLDGVFNFGSLKSFLTNHPKKYTASSFPSVLNPRGYRQTYFGAYLQDDWRWRPNLTLNLGLRYEMVTVPTEVKGQLTNLINITDASPHLGSPLFSNPTLRNFAPRVGFAWDPFNNGKTAVRGGFGVFDSLPLPYEYAEVDSHAAPFLTSGVVTKVPPGSFFAGAATLLKPGTERVAYIEQHPHRNYVMQWNLNIQQEITPSVVALVGYIGSRGVHTPFVADDSDLTIPTLTSAGYLWPAPIGSGPKINPNFGQIDGLFYQGNSFYDALEVGITKRMSHGVQFQTSYTWGKSIDNNSASVFGDQFSNSVSSLNWFDEKLTRALSDFNVGHTLVISITWQVPAAKSLSGPAAWLVNGWQLGTIFKVNDGVPYTPTWGTGGDPAGTNSSDDYAYPNRLSGPGCATLINPGNPDHYVKTQCFSVPTAPDLTFWNNNCDPAPPSLGYGFDPLNPANPVPANMGNPPPAWLPPLACFNLRGNAGRNIIIGPGIQNLDFSVFKNNPIKRISENFNVQFRAEFFNILNHPNFGDPNVPNAEADLFNATGASIGSVGHLTTTTTTAREIQFALKLAW
jgi:hypothetical protein